MHCIQGFFCAPGKDSPATKIFSVKKFCLGTDSENFLLKILSSVVRIQHERKTVCVLLRTYIKRPNYKFSLFIYVRRERFELSKTEVRRFTVSPR